VRVMEQEEEQVATVEAHARPGARGRWTVLAGLLLTLALITACGNGDDRENGEERPDPTPTVDAAAVPTPVTPEVDGRTYTFRAKGYAVDVPEGWRFEPNYILDRAGAQFAQDVMFHEDVIDSVQPNVIIECLRPREDELSSEDLRDRRLAVAELAGDGEVAQGEVEVGGEQAYVIRFEQSLRDRDDDDVIARIDRTEVLLVHGECRWMIAFVTPGGHRDAYEAAFDEVLASFRFVD
jgi:hypothetical protein